MTATLLTALIGLVAGLAACAAQDGVKRADQTSSADDRARERTRMVAEQIRARGITDARVLAALERVPRHRFVPPEAARAAYEDYPLPIGSGQTISQPYIVAYMSEMLQVQPDHKVLEIGTGSAYQAAVLAELSAHVYTIEIVEPLGRRAESLLRELGYDRVRVRIGDGYAGWPEEAPFDRIMVTAAPDHVPQPLLDQLAEGGRMIIPVGREYQELIVITRTAGGIVQQRTIPVRFVPLTRRER